LIEKTTIFLWPLQAVVKYDQVVIAALAETPLSLIIFSLRSPPYELDLFSIIEAQKLVLGVPGFFFIKLALCR
jgi:hypothetical protein